MAKTTTKIDPGKQLSAWNFPEYEQRERSKLWWVLFTSLSVLMIIIALVSANFLFALIILLADVIVLALHFKQPLQVDLAIFENGLAVGDKFFPWKEFDSFWIIYEPPKIKNIFLHFKTALKPRLTIPLDKQNPLEIRKILLEYLDEDLAQENEPTSDALSRVLKL